MHAWEWKDIIFYLVVKIRKGKSQKEKQLSENLTLFYASLV